MKGKKRCWVELGKDLLILLLICSAVFLVSRSPIVVNSGLAELFSDTRVTAAVTESTAVTMASPPVPARMAVGSERGLYAVQYDQATADRLFDTVSPLLGEALSSASGGRTMPQRQWENRLGGRCFFFDFDAAVPLSALCSWLKEGAENEALSGFARWIMLAEESNGTISLCCAGEEGEFFRYDTALDAQLHLSPLVDEITPNGAFFAFEDEVLSAIATPYTIFSGSEVQAKIYNSATPTILSDAALSGAVLSALSFSDQNSASVPEGTLYVDGDDTLRLSGSGRVVYDGSGDRYPAGEGIEGAVDASWALASAAASALGGDGGLRLLSAREVEEGSYTVTFGYVLNGSAVYFGEQGWAARFQISGGVIREFTMYLRTYTATSQQTLLLPADKAAAAMTALSDEPLELIVCYQDDGGSTVTPGWVGK